MAVSAAFSFVVPQCAPGATLSVNAPDGVKLKIPLPENILSGDELFMGKDAEGKWGITKAVRGASAPLPPAPAILPQWRSAEEMVADCVEPEVATVRLDTSKGPIFLKIVPKWAPIGAKRFLELVDDGYYGDIAIYRAIQGGLLQFGVVQDTDPRSTKYSKLEDDTLVGIPYAEGVVSFAAAGPGTRKSTVCIMKADFRTQLGKGQLGSRSTETPIGMVCTESMDVMHSITCLGDIPQCGGKGPDPGKLEAMGNAYIRTQFPTCDFVRAAARVD
jgi:cyclophilin family peptidyl-prolyl cis-trans isomerase